MLLIVSLSLFFTCLTINAPVIIAPVPTCKFLLPYNISTLTQTQYQKWYGKVGDSSSGTSYLPGHMLQRHIAVNGQCTAEQKSEKKTIFYNQTQMVRMITKIDNTVCEVSDVSEFNYRQQKLIPSASDYIYGIDCSSGTKMHFPKYYIQYKKTLESSKPNQDQYMRSMKVTIWTMYPQK